MIGGDRDPRARRGVRTEVHHPNTRPYQQANRKELHTKSRCRHCVRAEEERKIVERRLTEKTSVENPLGLHVHGRRKAREDTEVLDCRREDDKDCSAIVSESQRENGYVED